MEISARHLICGTEPSLAGMKWGRLRVSQHIRSSGYDQLSVSLNSALIGKGQMKVNFRFPYPTGNHTDDATDWSVPQKHSTEVILQDDHSFVLKRTLDTTVLRIGDL